MKQLEEFIKDKNLKFIPGQRNSDAVMISGYALYLGIDNVVDLCNIIENYFKKEKDESFTLDIDTEEEIIRVFNYAKSKNYGNFYKPNINEKLFS